MHPESGEVEVDPQSHAEERANGGPETPEGRLFAYDAESLEREARGLILDIMNFHALEEAGKMDFGTAAFGGAALTTRGALLTATTAVKVNEVADHARATNDQVTSIAEHARATNERVERLHQPRGLILLGSFIVLSNVAVAAAVLFTYYVLRAGLQRVQLSEGLATGIAASLIATGIAGILVLIVRKIRSILRGASS